MSETSEDDSSLPIWLVEFYYPQGVFMRNVRALNRIQAMDEVVEMFRAAGFRPVVISETYAEQLEEPDGESTGGVEDES